MYWLGAPLEIRKISHLGGARCRGAAPIHQEKSAEVAWAAVSDATGMPPWEVFWT